LIYLKAMGIPQLSSRSEVSLDALIERLLHLDVTEIVETLRKMSPAAAPGDDTEIGALIALHVGAYG
jgi:hypothetical protein